MPQPENHPIYSKQRQAKRVEEDALFSILSMQTVPQTHPIT